VFGRLDAAARRFGPLANFGLLVGRLLGEIRTTFHYFFAAFLGVRIIFDTSVLETSIYWGR